MPHSTPAPLPHRDAAPRVPPLTRAANLVDFDGCASVAVWQQRHAADAITRWQRTQPGGRWRRAGPAACINWGGATFSLPWAVYQTEYYDQAGQIPAFRAQAYAVIVALSVLDRVEAPRAVLRQYAEALLPGGLLIVTFALWNCTGPDCALGHELRRRIYNLGSWRRLLYEEIKGLGISAFGGVDLRYPGDLLGEHTLAALVLTRDGGGQ